MANIYFVLKAANLEAASSSTFFNCRLSETSCDSLESLCRFSSDKRFSS